LRLGSLSGASHARASFTADQLGTMVHMGFAAQTAERFVGTFRQASEIKRFKITEEGDQALGYER
jgi:hypothetical protein